MLPYTYILHNIPECCQHCNNLKEIKDIFWHKSIKYVCNFNIILPVKKQTCKRIKNN
jgi:hypothetical protein